MSAELVRYAKRRVGALALALQPAAHGTGEEYGAAAARHVRMAHVYGGVCAWGGTFPFPYKASVR